LGRIQYRSASTSTAQLSPAATAIHTSAREVQIELVFSPRQAAARDTCFLPDLLKNAIVETTI
jgi:hypothetical protein